MSNDLERRKTVPSLPATKNSTLVLARLQKNEYYLSFLIKL